LPRSRHMRDLLVPIDRTGYAAAIHGHVIQLTVLLF
jgi:hypothetical protein